VAEQASAAAEEARRTAEGEAERLKKELGLAKRPAETPGAEQATGCEEPHIVKRIIARLEVGYLIAWPILHCRLCLVSAWLVHPGW
jgi:hypothetical protein